MLPGTVEISACYTSFEVRMRHGILFIIYTLLSTTFWAQTGENPKSGTIVGMHVQGGYIMPHREEMKHLIQGHSAGLSLSILQKTDGKKYWQHAYNFPEKGIDLWFNSTGNSRQLGNQMDLKYLLNLPLNHNKNLSEKNIISSGQRFRHYLGLGIGIGYSTKIWDLRENHQAAVLGSHFNASLTIQYSASLLRTEQIDLRSGIRITHFSNGAGQIPNLGTNNLALFIGLYLNKNEETIPREPGQKPEVEKWRHTISIAGGLKEIQPPMSRKYGTFSLSLLSERRVSFKSSVGAGIDMFYNSSLTKLMERENISTQKTKAIQSGVLFGYTLHFDKFELKMQNGFYIVDNWKNDGFIYHRFGLRYRCTERLFTQLTLKTHFAKADFIEAGVGYAFR